MKLDGYSEPNHGRPYFILEVEGEHTYVYRRSLHEPPLYQQRNRTTGEDNWEIMIPGEATAALESALNEMSNGEYRFSIIRELRMYELRTLYTASALQGLIARSEQGGDINDLCKTAMEIGHEMAYAREFYEGNVDIFP